MCNRHPHADVICAWAEGKTIQQFVNNTWYDVTNDDPVFRAHFKFRVKPEPVEVRTCNGVVITPMKEKPKVGSPYYLAAPSASPFYVEYTWTRDVSDLRFFERGLVHSTEESAITHALAMLANKTEVRYV